MRFCIILGAMKAGTTSLFNYLAQHPEIAASKEKEPSFFSHHYENDIEYYLSLWRKEDLHTKVLMEASTNYTKHPSFPKSSQNLIDFAQRHDVGIKLIYVMRNPIERIESQYTYSYARWTSESLEERIQHGHIVSVSRYAHQLDLYYDSFNRDDFLLLDFDDLRKKPDELLRRICEFLDIDMDFQFSGLGEVHNKSQGAVITKSINNLYKRYLFIQSFSNLFPKSLKRHLSQFLFRKKITKNFELTEDQKKHIHETLKDDMARLHNKYGIDVSKWGFNTDHD